MRRKRPVPICWLNWKPGLLFTITILLIGVLSAFGQESSTREPAGWFAKPYDLPKDVFDLPEFDRFRSAGGKLNIALAQNYLEQLSDTNLPAAQRLFDIFAWRAFVALNWPT